MTNIVRQVSSSFGIAILTSIMNTRIAMHSEQMVNNFTSVEPGVERLSSRRRWHPWAGERPSDQVRMLGSAYLQGIVAQAAFVKGIDDVFIIAAGVTLFGVIPGPVPAARPGTRGAGDR